MYVQNLLNDIKKLKTEKQQLEFNNLLLEKQLDTFKKVDYANLSQKLSQMRKMAFARLVKEVILDKKNVNLSYELAKLQHSINFLNEDNQHLNNTKSELENKVNDLEKDLKNENINKEGFAEKLLELNEFLKRPTSLAEKLTISSSDWTNLHNTLNNIKKISEESIFSIKQKEEQINKLQTEKKQLEKNKVSLQNNLEAHVKLLENELSKEKLTDEEKEIIYIVHNYSLSNNNKALEKLETKKLENLPHLGDVPSIIYYNFLECIKLDDAINERNRIATDMKDKIWEWRKKTGQLSEKIRELENKNQDTLILLQTANNQKDAIAAEREELRTKVEELAKKMGELELEFKMRSEEKTELEKQKTINQENYEQAKKDFEIRIMELEDELLSDNELKIKGILEELFILTSNTNFGTGNLEELKEKVRETKNILNKLNFYLEKKTNESGELEIDEQKTKEKNPHLGILAVNSYKSINSFIISQEIIWKREKEAEETIDKLRKEIKLEVGEKNQLLEWLGIYRRSRHLSVSLREMNSDYLQEFSVFENFMAQHQQDIKLFEMLHIDAENKWKKEIFPLQKVENLIIYDMSVDHNNYLIPLDTDFSYYSTNKTPRVLGSPGYIFSARLGLPYNERPVLYTDEFHSVNLIQEFPYKTFRWKLKEKYRLK